jgi:hypothetical protein
MRQVTTATPTQGREGIPRWNAGGMAQCGRPARCVQARAWRCHRQQPGDPGSCVRHSAVTTDCHWICTGQIFIHFWPKPVTRCEDLNKMRALNRCSEHDHDPFGPTHSTDTARDRTLQENHRPGARRHSITQRPGGLHRAVQGPLLGPLQGDAVPALAD